VSAVLEGRQALAEEVTEVRPLRVGAVSYLNTAPLVHGLASDPGIRLSRDVPSRIAASLHAGEIDLGLVPSIEYAAGDYAIVPGLAIASRGPVLSVRLFLARPLAEARRVALDASSRTSVALLRILLREQLGREPEWVEMAPDVPAMLEAADAALVIGDPALDYAGGAEHLDLGAEWLRLTGLPFVWAFWAGPAGALSPGQVERLQRAAREGREAIPAIAAAESGGDPRRAERYASYLRGTITYSLGESELAGLRELYRRAKALALIARVPEIRFHDHP
jgi:chorismate dehydratase